MSNDSDNNDSNKKPEAGITLKEWYTDRLLDYYHELKHSNDPDLAFELAELEHELKVNYSKGAVKAATKITIH